ncbi:MAG: hypothetical protein M1818_002060 [Claussenomyces sp. TS43310]|nr:MAG: hypothetical protein M1818_002060 [Claussenomyces sp. TS43310]
MPIKPPLSQAWGYGIILGIGSLFALGMILITWILRRYNNEVQTSEMFSTAGRTVKSGLVASAVVSSWTWAATLLQSTSVAYKYGVSGPFWYASGATVQILLFASIAIELKRRAPNAHTFLEVVRARYGTGTHLVFTTFGLMTNILVTAMLLTGGSAAFTALTGIPTPAACFLLPLGVMIYTVCGGIKATFLTDYVHTLMLLIIIIIFALTTYSSSAVLGSPSAVFDLLVKAAADHPVSGNAGGSYLTMRSSDGVIFFIINIIGNFGSVFNLSQIVTYHDFKMNDNSASFSQTDLGINLQTLTGQDNWPRWSRDFKIIAYAKGVWKLYTREEKILSPPVRDNYLKTSRSTRSSADREITGANTALTIDTGLAIVEYKLDLEEYRHNDSRVDPAIRGNIQTYENPTEAWIFLTSLYKMQNVRALDIALGKLEGLRLENFKTLQQYLNEHEGYKLDIKAAGGEYSDVQMIFKIIRGLPTRYHPFIDQYYLLQDTNGLATPTLKDLTTRLLTFKSKL